MIEQPADSPIRPECWADFRKDYEAVWDQVVFLRTSLYLLRTIARFPLRRFLSIDDQWFLTVVGRSLYETVVLGVTKLVTDQKGDLLTLRRYRNRVVKMVRPECETEYRSQLDATALDRGTEALALRARDFRDGHVAHLRMEDVRKETTDTLVLDELERLVNDTERLFQPLSFGASASFLPPVYDPSVRAANTPKKTDIERILEFLASESWVLNEPENHPRTWPVTKAKMSAEELAVMNEWRVRLGKPSA